MEHHPYISMPDMTEITYSDTKMINGIKCVCIYYERPNTDRTDFDSFSFLFPQDRFDAVVGYTSKELENEHKRLILMGELLLEWNEEKSDA